MKLNRTETIIKCLIFNLFSIGTRRLEVTLENHKSSISGFVGSELRISGWFRRA